MGLAIKKSLVIEKIAERMASKRVDDMKGGGYGRVGNLPAEEILSIVYMIDESEIDSIRSMIEDRTKIEEEKLWGNR